MLLGFHPASGSCLLLCCGRPDGKLLSLRALDGPSSVLFTLGRISIKLTLSLLLPSIANSVCLCRVHFPLQLLFVTVNKWLLFAFFLFFFFFHQSQCSSQTRLLNVRSRDVCVSVWMNVSLWMWACNSSEQCSALYKEAKAGPVTFSTLTERW